MKPFLKWAGGKYKIINTIVESLPEGTHLIEPFTGSAAVFLNTKYIRYTLADANKDLIDVYKELQNNPSQFIADCKALFCLAENTEESYYRLREKFNSTSNTHEKATIFVYLNRHCFNGLCRYNSSGKFNVPFGRYLKPYFPEAELQFFAEQCKNATFICADFRLVMSTAKKGDVVYCDPPYAPLSETSNFNDYIAGGFNSKDQEDLADLATLLSNRGVSVIISNHNTKYTREIYKMAELKKFGVQRFIASKGSNRIIADELLALYS